MKHPRRLRFLVPLALLGAALLVRARLPRPQTEGDRWLWEQAEGAAYVDVVPNAYAVQRVKRLQAIRAYRGKVYRFSSGGAMWCQHTRIRDRAGLRALLRAFEGTHFSAGSPPPDLMFDFNENAGLDISLIFPPTGIPGSVGPGGTGHRARLYQNGKRFYIWRSDGVQSPIDAASVARFQNIYATAQRHTKERQAGYSTFPGECPNL